MVLTMVRLNTTISSELINDLKDAGVNLHRGFYKQILEQALIEHLDKVQKFELLKKETRDFKQSVNIELGLLNEKINELIIMKEKVTKLSDKVELHHRLINKHITDQAPQDQKGA